MSADPMMPTQHVPIPQRGTYIPEWGNAHHDLSKSVLADGMPTGFQVGDILPEKRWAIDSETGKILPQGEFEPLYQRWISLYCTGKGDLIPIAQVNRHFNPGFESCPNAREFVMTTIDEDGHPCPVGWESRRNQAPTGPRMLWDATGENARTATETLRIYKAQKAMKELQGMEKLKNILPAETYQDQVDGVLSKHGLTVGDLTAGLADAPEGFDRVPVSEDDIHRLEKMASEEAGEPAPDVTDAVTDAPKVFMAPCGKECKNAAGVSAHARRCEKCNPVVATEEVSA